MNKKSPHTQHVYIIGCKGIPAQYGGFETFVDKLTEYQTDKSIRYHVACAAEPKEYHPKKKQVSLPPCRVCRISVAQAWTGAGNYLRYRCAALFFAGSKKEADRASDFLHSGVQNRAGDGLVSKPD